VLYARGGIDGLLESFSTRRIPVRRGTCGPVDTLAGARHA
jgi:hypothetical protein